MASLHSDEALIEFFIPYHWSHPAIKIYILTITSDQIHAASVPLDGLSSTLDPGRMQLGFADKDGTGHFQQPIESSPLGEKVAWLRVMIQRGDDDSSRSEVHHLLETLYGLLISPILACGVRPQDFKRWM
jgi:hypothetical protein